MKLLIDTNVFIPLEPTNHSDQEALTEITAELHKLAIEAGFQIFLHPAATIDIEKDSDKERKNLRHVLFKKYPTLPDPPSVSEELHSIIGTPPFGSNDWVDHQLAAALYSDAVDFLVTEDGKLRNKIRKLGLYKRVATVAEAISLIEDLIERIPRPPPAVRALKAHAIDQNDAIFDSFKSDYKGFEKWFRKCRREHRQAWVINGVGREIAGLCIINHEKDPPNSISGKVLKICSFKVAPEFNGFRFGELLLKTVFEHAIENQYEWVFVTVFDKYGKLIELFEDFGFSKLDERTSGNELIFVKPLRPETKKPDLSAIDYHIRYGPKHFRTDVPWYVIPIQPKYAKVLFPETVQQSTLFQMKKPYSNSIRKAYLCNSQIRSISEDSVLLFYRSHEERGLIALGIVEESFKSSVSDKIARTVGKRTVYSLDEINELCQSSVLVILFRQAKVYFPVIPVKKLLSKRLFRRPPQSIMSLKGKGLSWIKQETTR
jgi:L-amino acid N-acyltransferase YncA